MIKIFFFNKLLFVNKILLFNNFVFKLIYYIFLIQKFNNINIIINIKLKSLKNAKTKFT